MDDLDALEISSMTSAYELDLENEVEKAEEFKNQFYDGLEAQPELFETEPVKEKINPDEDDEDIDNFIDEIDGDKFASLDLQEEPLNPGLKEPGSEIPRQSIKLQPLAPVKLNEFKEIEIEPEVSINPISYLNFLHQEIGESKEMYKMREKIAKIIADVEIPRGKANVSLDASAIIIFSRMITNKLWFGMKYNKEQEELIQALIKYTPEIKF